MGNGKWGMGNGEWEMAGAHYPLGNGLLEMGNGKWEVENWKLEIVVIFANTFLFDARGLQLGGMTSMEGKGILVSFIVISF